MARAENMFSSLKVWQSTHRNFGLLRDDVAKRGWLALGKLTAPTDCPRCGETLPVVEHIDSPQEADAAACKCGYTPCGLPKTITPTYVLSVGIDALFARLRKNGGKAK